MAERSRWLLLVLALIAALGGVQAVTLLTLQQNQQHALATLAQSQRQAQRDICELVEAYDAEYRANPPQTETGRRIAERTRQYVERKCS